MPMPMCINLCTTFYAVILACFQAAGGLLAARWWLVWLVGSVASSWWLVGAGLCTCIKHKLGISSLCMVPWVVHVPRARKEGSAVNRHLDDIDKPQSSWPNGAAPRVKHQGAMRCTWPCEESPSLPAEVSARYFSTPRTAPRRRSRHSQAQGCPMYLLYPVFSNFSDHWSISLKSLDPATTLGTLAPRGPWALVFAWLLSTLSTPSDVGTCSKLPSTGRQDLA